MVKMPHLWRTFWAAMEGLLRKALDPVEVDERRRERILRRIGVLAATRRRLDEEIAYEWQAWKPTRLGS